MFSFFASKKSYTCSTLLKLINFNENQLIKINNINIPKKELIIISFLGNLKNYISFKKYNFLNLRFYIAPSGAI